MPDPQDAGCVEHLTPEEASRIIHSHRKVRYGTACWPCRQRKVKCDNKSPCENCVKREHPQLCSYRPNRTAASTTAVSVQHAQGQKRSHSPDDVDSETRETQRRSPRSLSTEPTSRAYESDLAETRYLGQNSIPALLREQGSPATQTPGREGEGVDTIRQDMRSIFGLDDSAPFPLMSSRHLDRLTQDISSELPSDRDVMKYASLLALVRLLRSRYCLDPWATRSPSCQAFPHLQGDSPALLGLCRRHRRPRIQADGLPRGASQECTRIHKDDPARVAVLAGRSVRRPRRWLPVPRLALPRPDTGLAAIHPDILSFSPRRQLSHSVRPLPCVLPPISRRRPLTSCWFA